MRCGLPDAPRPYTATTSSPTTSRSKASATCLLMKVLLLPPSTRRSPSYLLFGIVMTTLAVLQRWLSSSRVEATWMVTILRLLGGWWDSSVSSGHSAWWWLPLLHCLQVGVGESRVSVLWLALMQISHLPFFPKIFRLSARVDTLVQAMAKWSVSSQKKQFLGRGSWLLEERVLVARADTVDLDPWEAANRDLLYASVTVCAASLFQTPASRFWISWRIQWRKEWTDRSPVSATFLHAKFNSIGSFPRTMGMMVWSKLVATPAASKVVRWQADVLHHLPHPCELCDVANAWCVCNSLRVFSYHSLLVVEAKV